MKNVSEPKVILKYCRLPIKIIEPEEVSYETEMKRKELTLCL